MRKALVVTAVLALGVTTVLPGSTASAAEWRSLEPASGLSTVTLMVDSKRVVYHRFDGETPLRFSVEGPTRLKILTRLSIPNDRDEDSYAVVIARDGALVATKELSSVPSDRAFYVALNHSRPGVIRRIYVDVPTGRHGYELRSRDRTFIDARVFEAAGGKPARLSLAPREYESVETLYYRDKELVYYLLTKRSPVVLDVIGPTSVKVNTRLLYDATMSSQQMYVLGVRQQDGSEMLYKIESVPSETVVCRDRGDLIPGALRHFVIDVGEGAHTYEFRLADAAAGALALKFYIPRGDLPNEP